MAKPADPIAAHVDTARREAASELVGIAFAADDPALRRAAADFYDTIQVRINAAHTHRPA
jgi:tRNA(Leu) C34 or U34 (ribose-2'-O)-methylase TrmL